MFCESWRETLGAAAMGGETLPREARAHLAACGGCRSAFAQEQQLFAWVDTGMQTVANAESPTSLLPRVRAAIAKPNARATWHVSVGAFAGAGLLLIAAIAYEWTRAPLSPVPPRSVATIASTPDIPPHIPNPEIAASLAQPAASPRIHSVHAVSLRREPEILVSGQEQANLRLYLNRLRARNVNNAAPLIITGDAQIQPLEIARIDVPELTIEPLENGDSR